MQATARCATSILVLSLAFAAASAQAAEPSLCRRLAVQARAVAPAAWDKGDAALAPALSLMDDSSASTGVAQRISEDAAVRKALDAGAYEPIPAEILPDVRLAMAVRTEGTLECREFAFARLDAQGKPSLVPAPARIAHNREGDLCWTRTADLGHVFGQAAVVEHGANDQTTDDEDIFVTPWTAAGWGRTCAVKLRFRRAFALTARHCGDAAVCAMAGDQAPAIAKAYDDYRRLASQKAAFTAPGQGSTTPPDAIAAYALDHAGGTGVPDFPLFGDKPDPSSPEGEGFSYSGLAYFPLTLGGVTYLAAAGHAGVGWRESDTTLLAVYVLQDGALVPKASFAIDRSVAGLNSAKAG